MAREPNRRGGIFGGKGSLREGLRDTSGNQRVGLEDTWLGDFIGLDGRIGAQGAGLRQSWFGARRDGPGSEANIPNADIRRPAARPSNLRTDNLERTGSGGSYYRESGGDGLRDPNPVRTDMTTSGPSSRPVIGERELDYGPQNGRPSRVAPVQEELSYGPQNGRGGRRGSTEDMTADGPSTRPSLGARELDYGPQNGRGSVAPSPTRRGGAGISLATINLEDLSGPALDVVREQLAPYEVDAKTWSGMTRAQREAAGLPTSVAGFDWRATNLLSGEKGTVQSRYRQAPGLMEATPEAPYKPRTGANPTQPIDKIMTAASLSSEGFGSIYDPDVGKEVSVREYLDKPLDEARLNWLANTIALTVPAQERQTLFRRNPYLRELLNGEYGYE